MFEKPTTDKTGVFKNFFRVLLLTSEISKGVNDNTKNKVEDYDDNHEEEQQVIDDSCSKQILLYQ